MDATLRRAKRRFIMSVAMTIETFDTSEYRGTVVAEPADLASLAATVRDYRVMLGAVLEDMLDRYERNPEYHFVDTKLSLLDGRDFPDDDPVRGPSVIYGWIQGRGLEALVGHAEWLHGCDDVAPALRKRLLPRVERMIAEVFARCEGLRAANGGRMFFSMTVDGKPLKMGPDGRYVPFEMPAGSPANVTELFYVKGMAAAAELLDDRAKLAEACQWYAQIDADIQANRLAGDQQPLDPTNAAVRSVPGRQGNGGRMLALGAASLFIERTGEPAYADMGISYLDYMLAHHVNTSESPELGLPYDGWEFIRRDDGRPFVDPAGTLLSDPGHACEFVGFAAKLLHAIKLRGLLPKVSWPKVKQYERILPAVLERNFANGFSPAGFGIVKAYDLIARKPLRTDMPWWNLPETMRAAAGVAVWLKGEQRAKALAIAGKCSNAFMSKFLRPDLHLMAYQTIGADGKPVATIPATPDADPGYHTGLSIIDYLDWLGEMGVA